MSFKILAVLVAFGTTSQAAKIAPIPSQQQDSIVNLLANVPKPSESKAKASEMEQMVMLLAQQAKLARKQSQGADGNVTELVKQIKEELERMEKEVVAAAGVADAACHEAYENLSVGCPLYSGNTTFLPEGFTGDFNPIRSAHIACRAEVGAKQQELDACKSSRETLISLEQTLTTEFQGINIFESPEECTVKGDDVLMYLGSMRDHFRNKQLAWWKTYYHLENVTANITQWNCTEKEVEYFEKITECQALQLELEETACQVHERTNESCSALPACHNAKWTNYMSEVAASNRTIQDLKYEYRAIQRITCLLDAFSAQDMDAAIDACIAERHTAAAIRSACVDDNDGVSKPSFVTPAICAGITSILHPSDPNFNETEYAAHGVEASKCLASCCTVDWYHWSTYNNAYVTQEHYMMDADTGRMAAFGSMDQAKAACEMMGSVLCFGIYDTKCDGANDERPVTLIKAPGLDLDSVKESNIGSCVLRMKLGSETTVTTTIAQTCSYQINVSRTDQDPTAVWKTFNVDNQEYGEVFRFNGCANAELDEAADCVASGVANGVRVLKNRHGQAVGTGVCCASATNTVLSTKAVQCDGFVDNYTKFESKYLTSSKLIRGKTYSNMESAREACLRMGHKCWGIFDDKCDTVNLMLVDGYIDVDESTFKESSQASCILKKQTA